MSVVGAPALWSGGRALLVEDNAIVALNAEDMLLALGFERVDKAAAVAEALRLARTHSYAAALVDRMVRDGDAAPVARLLIGAGVPLVFATGYDDDIPLGLDGAVRLAKPYDEESLRAALSEARGRTTPKR